MRILDLNTPAAAPAQPERLARLARHLEARLKDFVPGLTQVSPADQTAGVVSVRFPGRDAGQIAARLERDFGIRAGLEEDRVVFRLSPEIRFEELDRLWGCILQLLEE